MILSEGFESTFPGAWTVGDTNPLGIEAYWGNVQSGFGLESPHSGRWMGYCAGIGYGENVRTPTYQDEMSATLQQRIDLTGYSSATLSFWYKMPSVETDYDWARVHVDGEPKWSSSTPLTTWTQVIVDLTSAVGATHTLAFRFDSDRSTTAEGWYLDDILVTAILQPPAIDLAMSKRAAPDPIEVSTDLTYLLRITNLRPTVATGVTVVDDLPEGTVFESAVASQGTCSYERGRVLGHLGTLEPESSATVTIAVRPTLLGTVVNSASVSADQADANARNDTDSVTTTVIDTTPPTISCPRDVVTTATPGGCSRQVTFPAPTVRDNADPSPTVGCDPPSGSIFPVGDTTVTCIATDASGNHSTCQFTVTVHDEEAPHITCPPQLVVTADRGQCSTSNVTFTATATDNCGPVTVTCQPPSGAAFPTGVSPVICTAVDQAGNSAQCTFQVVVRESEPPTIVCPPDVVEDPDPGLTTKSNVLFAALAFDNCPGVTVSCHPPSGSTFPIGVTPVTCTAVDASGNISSCSFTVIIRDPDAFDPCSGSTRLYVELDLNTGVQFGLAPGSSSGDQEMILAEAGPPRDRRRAIRPAMNEGTPGAPHHYLNFAILNQALGPSSQPNAHLAICVTYFDDPALEGATFRPEAYQTQRREQLQVAYTPPETAVALQGTGQWCTAYFEIPDVNFTGVNQQPQGAARFLLSDKIFFSAVRYAVIPSCGPAAGLNLLEPWKPGEPTRLSLQWTESQSVSLSWPLHPDGFVLQAADNLERPRWTTVEAAPQQEGDRWLVTQQLAQTRFYRLAARPAGEPRVTVEPLHRSWSAVTTPTLMYCLQRYFAHVPPSTDLDRAVHATLDAAPGSQALFEIALANYLALPDDRRSQLYDPATLAQLLDYTRDLPLGFLSGRVQETAPGWALKPESPPAAPTQLTATNASTYSTIDNPARYRIALHWKDNAADEQGFRIYRADGSSLLTDKGQLIAEVAANTTDFLDSLPAAPPFPNHHYCYHVVAFRHGTLAWAGQPAPILDSSPSETACSTYYLGPWVPPTDSDFDGIPDAEEDPRCVTIHRGPYGGWWTGGCPDADNDGVPDIDDYCQNTRGESIADDDTGPLPLKGCPIKYSIRWMGIKVLNNSEPHYSDGQLVYAEGNDPFDFGEEPYLLFSFVNGITTQGSKEEGQARWCCGERVSVDKGLSWEPDTDDAGEEFKAALPQLLQYGLAVFPAMPGQFAAIDEGLGLVLTMTLMERDWTMLVTPEQKMDELGTAIKFGTAVVSTFATCAGTGGIGCLAGFGALLKSAIEDLFGSAKQQVEVSDPDDFIGTDVWTISRQEAMEKTSGNGAYAFYIRMPWDVHQGCWVVPCGPSTSHVLTMQAHVYFVLFREGTTEAEIQNACKTYHYNLPVLPFDQ